MKVEYNEVTKNHKSGLTYLVDLFVGEIFTTGDILPSYSLVHVGLDGAGGDGVDGDFLVTGINGLD